MLDEFSPLKGARIWLSGSIPDERGAAERFEAFVTQLSTLVFEAGGAIIHGSHPSIVPMLLAAAARHQQITPDASRNCLTLAASKFYRPAYESELPKWERNSIVQQVPAGNDEEASLRQLRHFMADRSDALIGIGGKWWNESQSPRAPGIPREFEFARQRGLPCFLLGGLGGAADGYLREHPEILHNLRNGLDPGENLRIANEQNVETIATQVVKQLSQLPLVRGEPLGKTTFRILALDGGGIKGTFTAAVLTAWERELDRMNKENGTELRLTDHFDMIAGTSTGGILALGLGMGLRAAEILSFYVDRGPTIFPMTSLADDPTSVLDKVWKSVASLFAPQYDANTLHRELEAAFKNAERKVLGRSRCRLVVPAVHARTGSVHVFCTDHHPDLTQYADTPAATVALATAAAPTFFAAATVGDGLYLDGGLWANNPSLAALTEAVARLHVPLDHIDVLSVGTTSEPYTGGQANEGFIGWLRGKRIINLLMHAQEQGTVALANELAGRARVLRIDQTLAPGQVSLADISGISTLRDDGLRAGADRGTLADVKARFLNGIKVAPWKETEGE